MRRVISIDESQHWADYAEMRVLNDQERFARTSPRGWAWKPMLSLLGKISFPIVAWVSIVLLAGGALRLFVYMVINEVIHKIQ